MPGVSTDVVLVPLAQVGRPGEQIRTVPRFVRHGPPEIRCDAGLVATGRADRGRHVVETSDGTWVVRTSPHREVRVTDASGAEIAWLARTFWRRRRRGRVGDTVVHYRPSSLWRRGGRWVDDAGRVLLTVRVHDRGFRRSLTCTPAPSAAPGPWVVLLVLLADEAAYDTAPLADVVMEMGAGLGS